jgi:uracil-DNA glycosylase
MVNIGNKWDKILAPVFEGEGYKKLRTFLAEEYRTKNVYPDKYDIFNALKATDYDDVKVVILGQDPYHGKGQAHGMCFSVKPDVPAPPSLVNIFKEIKAETGVANKNPCLTKWAEEGVLLLNAVLTVREASPNSHKGKGWEEVTDAVISALNDRQKPVIFLLWGGNARAKKNLITSPQHAVLECAHPSPLSAYNGFFGCGHFTKTNALLTARGEKPINWRTE